MSRVAGQKRGRRRKRRRRAPLSLRQVPSRRRFLGQGLALLGASLAAGLSRPGLSRPGRGFIGGDGARAAETERPPIRPPTANPIEARFRDACIRCGLCGIVCENGCIRFFGAGEVEHGALTPYLDLRRRSCTLCMRCTHICPTGALSPVCRDPVGRDPVGRDPVGRDPVCRDPVCRDPAEADLETIASRVDMGTAVVDPDRCLSYLGRICGYCHDACPLPGTAIRLTPPGKPVVLADGCVGCGRCVEMCPQVPTAIDVLRDDHV